MKEKIITFMDFIIFIGIFICGGIDEIESILPLVIYIASLLGLTILRVKLATIWNIEDFEESEE